MGVLVASNSIKLNNAGIVTLKTAGLMRLREIMRHAGGVGADAAANPMGAMYRQWGKRYAVFTRRRFISNSRGGGDWPPLKAQTKDARRGPGSRDSRRTAIIARYRRDGVVLTPGELRIKLLESTRRANRTKIRNLRKNNLYVPSRAKLKNIGVSATGKKTDRIYSILVDTGGLRDAIEPQATGNLLEQIPNGVRYGFSGVTHPNRGKGDPVTMGDLAAFHHFGKKPNPRRTILVKPDDDTLRGMEADARRAGDEIVRRLNSIADFGVPT